MRVWIGSHSSFIKLCICIILILTGIDTDRHKYPIGSGRVSFDNYASYFKAVLAAFVEINSSKFEKIVQVDPYLEDATCSACTLQQAPYFCRDLTCFRYFCRTCFEINHTAERLRSHRPLMRNPNKQNNSSIGFTAMPMLPANSLSSGFAGTNNNSFNFVSPVSRNWGRGTQPCFSSPIFNSCNLNNRYYR